MANPLGGLTQQIANIPDDAGVVFPPLLAARWAAQKLIENKAPIAEKTLGGVATGLLRNAVKPVQDFQRDPTTALQYFNPGGVAGTLLGENARLSLGQELTLSKAKVMRHRGVEPGKIARDTGWDPRSGLWEYDVVDNAHTLPDTVVNGEFQFPATMKYYADTKVPQRLDPTASNPSTRTRHDKNGRMTPEMVTFPRERPRKRIWPHEGQHVADVLSGAAKLIRGKKEPAGYTYDPNTGQYTFHNLYDYLRRRSEIRARVNEMRMDWSEDLRKRVPAYEMHEWEANRLKSIKSNIPVTNEEWMEFSKPTHEEYANFLKKYFPEEEANQAADYAVKFGSVKPRSQTVENFKGD